MFYPLPLAQVISFVGTQRECVFLDTACPSAENRYSYIFYNPARIIECRSLTSINTTLQAVDAAVARGWYAAGFISYEAGYGLLPHLPAPRRDCFPLLRFGLFKKPFIFDHRQNCWRNGAPAAVHAGPSVPTIYRHAVDCPRTDYSADIRRIQQLIAAGDTYQVNHTIRYHFRIRGPGQAVYAHLRRMQPTAYCAWLRTAGYDIMSYSPELFFRRRGNSIIMEPMKGTIARGCTPAQDNSQHQWLRQDIKNRAENIMIVDLLRNDLSIICRCGSVRAKHLFTVQAFPTLLQMTSRVSGCLQPHTDWPKIFRALFPSGSITGAPKIRTMQIIRRLERTPRRVYTGAIGFIAPHSRSAVFSVAIRTALIENGQATFGVGSGITADSTPGQEYRECRLKAEFIRRGYFQLIETMRVERGRIALLSAHLRRLRRAAVFFNFIYDRKTIASALHATAQQLAIAAPHRLRLLLAPDGTLRIITAPLAPLTTPVRLTLASRRTTSTDIYLRYKTTQRALYDRLWRQAQRDGFFDCIFCNEHGQITEGAISTIFIQKGKILFTPPLRCGVLPGVYRQHLLSTRTDIREAVLRIEDLRAAEAIFCANAVRGLIAATLPA